MLGRAALRVTRAMEQHQETRRDRRKVSGVDHAIRDVRYGFRVLARTPVFAAVAILSLALGIGANAAIFELIDAVRLRNLPITHPEELGEVRTDGAHAFGITSGIDSEVTYPLWEQIQTHQDGFRSIFAWGHTAFLVDRDGDIRRARGLWVSGDFFRSLGVIPERGRLLTSADDHRGCGAGPAVVSHAFWSTHLGAQDSAIGRPITLTGRPFTIVGVTPPSFTGLAIGQSFDVAVPVCAAALSDDTLDRRDLWWLTVMGRLKPGWTIARAEQQLRAIGPGILEATIPPGFGTELVNQYRSFKFSVIPAGRGVSILRDAYGMSLSLLPGLTAMVLLITCGNLAMLMLARASRREREIAVRAALGASRRRLISQLLVESALLAIAGAALAIPSGVVTARTLVALFSTPGNAIELNLMADWRLLSFVGATAMSTILLFGLVPAVRVSLVDPVAAMRPSSRGLTMDRHRAQLQRGLVVAQVAVSLVLIVAALTFVQSFRKLTTVALGFDADNAVSVSFLDLQSAALSHDQRIAFQQRLTDEIGSVPGVTAAVSTTRRPFSLGNWAHYFRVTGAGSDERRVSRFTYVGPGYFPLLKIPMLSGRDFAATDNSGSRRVMLVNESFVRGHLGGLSPIGTTIRTIAEAGYPETTYEIIGVVGNTKYGDLRDEDCWCGVASGGMPPIAYAPIAQDPGLAPWGDVLVRAEAITPALTSAIVKRVHQLNPAILVEFIDPRFEIHERLVNDRVLAWLAGAFGVLAIVIVTVGLYGLVAYLTASRQNEIGIRLSLGATRTDIVVLVLREGLWLLGAGLVVGIPLTLAALRGIGALLFGLSATHVPTLGAAVALLALAAIAASLLPAWRAAMIHPDVALRCE